ncbi:MAG TPA: hypothetical protein VGN79_12330 [Devosia sp.]|jgi:hypothetical protein|nr:hypothetical protein [Devosia sp.]
MEKQIYDVAEGVAWVNGAKTPKSRKVELTAAEASYDLGLGRITPESKSSKLKASSGSADKAAD